MGPERRGCIVQPRPRANGSQLATGGARGRGKAAGRVCQRLNIGSRVNREVHARIWERPGVRFLRATRRVSRASSVQTAVRNCTRDEGGPFEAGRQGPVSYTHLRAHETRHDLVCRLLLEKKKNTK